MNKYDIAFIIPAYNVAEYLSECLDSILMQSNINKQIIIINDGSSDNTLEIAQEYKKKYAYISIINKNNEGVSVARNVGIEIANAEYICFMDGDDKYLFDYASAFLEKCRKYDLDIIRGRYQRFKTEEIYKSVYPHLVLCKNEPLTGKEYLQKTILMRTSEVVPWLGFFKSSFLKHNNIVFPDGISYTEDQLFFLNALLNAHRILDVPDIFYGYRVRENSATSGLFSEKKVKDICWIVDKELDFVSRYYECANDIRAFASTTLSQIFPFYKKANKRQKDEIIGYLKKYKKKAIIRNSYNWKIGVKLFAALYIPIVLKIYAKF